MLLSARSRLSFRFADKPGLRTVYGIGIIDKQSGVEQRRLPTVPNDDKADGGPRSLTWPPLHVGAALSVPFWCVTLHDLVERRVRAEEEKKGKKSVSAAALSSKRARSRDEDGAELSSQDGGKVVLAFACPSQARLQADGLSVETNNEDGKQEDGKARQRAEVVALDLGDARFLSERMNVPLCVVLRSWCALVGETKDEAEVFLHMPSRHARR